MKKGLTLFSFVALCLVLALLPAVHSQGIGDALTQAPAKFRRANPDKRIPQQYIVVLKDDVGDVGRGQVVRFEFVKESSEAMTRMKEVIEQVEGNAADSKGISELVAGNAEKGMRAVISTIESMDGIYGSVSRTCKVIESVGRRGQEIGLTLHVIQEVTEQTNLLALNAAIEAARAGEHGLGFAVVADEVRKLAEKSAQSTREISDLIQSIQKEARKAVENMEKSTTIVNEGLTLGGDLSAALKKISNVVAEVYKFAQEIGAATNEQSHGSSQIAKATTRLNEITHEINSSVEEQASGAQAVVKAMEKMRELVQRSSSGSTELAASSEQMSKMARTMLESMDRFVFDLHQQNGNGRNGSARYDVPQPPKRGGPARFTPSSPAYN